MENRIESERRGRKPEEVENLNLDNIKSKTITGLTDEYKGLKTLSVINAGLTSLEGLPKLPSLKRLDLSDNKISDGLESITGCPALTHLNLAGNSISSIDALNPLTKLENLVSLDLFNCEVSHSEKYREKVFKMFPNLKWLDGTDENDELEESENRDDAELDDNMEDLSDEEQEDDEDDDEKVGLAYLDSSEVMQDEDETEDFNPDDEDSKDGEKEQRGEKRKRTHDDGNDDEN
uniref:LRRcap domain-containing protein n=1 Tax=Syphacia muris TaxID=451379 RepID=A0A0N5A7Q8_9BILA